MKCFPALARLTAFGSVENALNDYGMELPNATERSVQAYANFPGWRPRTQYAP